MTRTLHRSLAAALAASALAASAASAQAPPGEALFKQQCGTCHTIAPGAPKLGPALKGVVGRKAATVSGYAYSTALKNSGITWTAAKLDAYLAKPTATVPGTKMMIGAANPAQRTAIIAYLSTQK